MSCARSYSLTVSFFHSRITFNYVAAVKRRDIPQPALANENGPLAFAKPLPEQDCRPSTLVTELIFRFIINTRRPLVNADASAEATAALRALQTYIVGITNTTYRTGKINTYVKKSMSRNIHQKLYPRYDPAWRHVVWKMFCGDTRTGPEVIGVHTLNFKPNFKFLRLEFFGGTPVPLRVCAMKAWSISSACKIFGAQHLLRAEI